MMRVVQKFWEGSLKQSLLIILSNTEYHKEYPPHFPMVKNIEDLELLLDYFCISHDNCILDLHYNEDFIGAHEEPLIKYMDRDPPHIAMIYNIEELDCHRGHFSDNDNVLSHIDTYKEIHQVCNVGDENPIDVFVTLECIHLYILCIVL